MKTHTQTYKENIKTLGRQLDSKITYTVDNEEIELGGEELNSVSPHYEGGILKSVMKQLDLDSNVDIPLGTEINYQFGIKVGNAYEYLNYGNYIVYSSEKQEDTRSYKIVAYDKMLYAMKDYENVGYTFPMTIRDYIGEICNTLGLTFANINDTFANYDKQLTQDMFLDANGAFLGYTFRDVLDQLAEATASTICINENDELEVRYIENVGEYSTVSGTDIHIDNSDDEADIDLSLEGDTYQYTTTGKNLLNTTATTQTKNGVTFTKNNDGSWNVNGTATAYTSVALGSVRLTANTTYTLSGGGLSGTYFIQALNGETYPSTPNGYITFTQTNNYTATIYIVVNANKTLNNVILKPMIEVGNTAHDYEPYTNGASPNPDYPQDIEVVTGRQVFSTTNTELPYGYKQVEYIESTGTQYIMTNFVPINKMTYYLDVEKTDVRNTGQYFMGYYSGDYYSPLVLNGSSAQGKIGFAFGNSGWLYTNTFLGLNERHQYKTYLGTDKMTIWQDGIQIGNSVLTRTFGVQTNLTIFAYRYQGSNLLDYGFIGRLYSASAKDENDNTLFNFIPCIRATDNKPGVYDMVSNTFYSNAGTGEFLYGNVVGSYKEYEINLGKNLLISTIDYIKSRNTQGTWSGNSYTWRGVTFTINDDMSITTSGTFEQRAYLYISKHNYNIAQGTYFLSGCPSGGGATFYRMACDIVGTSTTTVFDTGAGVSIDTSSIDNPKLDFYIDIRGAGGVGKTFYPMLEKGSQKTSYSKYFEPIWLGGIGTYQDKIDKSSGKNLIGLDTAQYKVSLKAGDKIYAQNTTSTALTLNLYTNYGDSTRNDYWSVSANGSRVITVANDSNAIAWTSAISGGVAWVSYGSTATEYEPYGTNWYLKKEIGKVVLNGSENWQDRPNYNTWDRFVLQTTTIPIQTVKGYSQYFKVNFTPNDELGYIFENVGTQIGCNFSVKGTTTLAQFKEWLSTHNTTVYYVLATPTYTQITNTELISQLEAVRLLLGENNISITSSNLSTPISLKYLSERDTIDEEFFKDINVNFGEKYGKVNSIVLSRSAGADNVYLRDEESVEENGLCEIKISDNQIMNGNDRAEYLTDILGKLNGLEYYINDFSSTGITYYDLCDKYKVSIDGNAYNCVMFNDEVNVTQGLEELIHTDMPEQSETEYDKADKTDRKVNQAYAIVDKQNGVITNFVSQTTQTQQLTNQRILELTERTNTVEQTLTSTQATIEVMQQDIIDGQETLRNNLVTIDINGINVSTNTSAIATLMTNEKFVIKSGNTYLAYFGYDQETNSTKAEMDNLTVTNYFMAGYHRVEKMTIGGENRTGYFYIGGGN